MPIDPIVPVIGVILIAANVLLAAARPYSPPVLMGVQLFGGGIVTLMIAVVDLINPLGIGAFERFLLFFAGVINCSAGYYMVLRTTR